MRQTVLLASSCALLGGLVGGAIVLWLSPRDRGGVSVPAEARALEEPFQPRAPDTQLLRRVESVEQALRSLQARSSGLPQASALQGSSPGGGAPAAAGEATPAPSAVAQAVGDPVFEAAVLDVIERAEEDRDSQRDVRRSERARQRAEHWSRELTTRLELTPAQASKLLEIRTQLDEDLRARRNVEDGQFVPREQRRAEREALRARAEKQLRSVLQPAQVARYEDLEGELKIVRPPDDD